MHNLLIFLSPSLLVLVLSFYFFTCLSSCVLCWLLAVAKKKLFSIVRGSVFGVLAARNKLFSIVGEGNGISNFFGLVVHPLFGSFGRFGRVSSNFLIYCFSLF